MRISGRGLVAAGGMLLLALCCGGSIWWTQRPGPEIIVDTDQAAPPKLSIVEPGRSGMVAGSAWPKACGLVSDDELRAVLPQATAIKRTPMGQTFRTGMTPEGFAQTVDVPEAACRIEFDLPGRNDPESGSLEVRLGFVGSQFYAESNYDDFGDKIDVPGADVCHRSGATHYSCRRGGVDFEVSGGVTEDVNFAGQKGEADAKALTIYGMRVLIEYVKLILAKLP